MTTSGCLRASLFEQTPHGPEHLAAGAPRAGRTDRAQDSLGDELPVLGTGEQFANAVVAAERADDLDERPERDPVSVREAAPGERAGFVSNAAAELCGQSRLADPCGTDDRDEPARTIGDRTRERLAEHAQLARRGRRAARRDAAHRRARLRSRRGRSTRRPGRSSPSRSARRAARARPRSRRAGACPSPTRISPVRAASSSRFATLTGRP